MSLALTGQVNPLAVHGLRKLMHCPPHFTKVSFDLKQTQVHIENWIWVNFTGRFYVGDDFAHDDHGRLVLRTQASFELEGEASYFALMLDSINDYQLT